MVDELDLDELPQGKIHRLRVLMVHNGLSRSIRVPVLVARGDKPGPVFGLTAALHGNELNGIPVIHRLFDSLDPGTMRGSVVAVVVANVPGYLLHQRAYSEGSDLNHLFPGKANGNASQVYAHRLLHRVVNRFSYLVDLHTASFGRVNSLYVRADMTNQLTAQMAQLLRPQIIVHNPPSDHTLRGAAEDLNIPAITAEIGNPSRFHRDFIKRSLAGLRSILGHVGILGRRTAAPSATPVLCSDSAWLYTDHGGLLEVFPDVTDVVEKGQLIARLSNAFGDVVREYHAPSRGVVIGKSVDPVSETGARILHLGQIAAPDDPRFAAIAPPKGD